MSSNITIAIAAGACAIIIGSTTVTHAEVDCDAVAERLQECMDTYGPLSINPSNPAADALGLRMGQCSALSAAQGQCDQAAERRYKEESKRANAPWTVPQLPPRAGSRE